MYGGGAYHPTDAGGDFLGLVGSPELMRSRGNRWLEAVKALPQVDPSRVAAIGYCFGGLCVLELARSGADLQAVVAYHGLLTTQIPAAPGRIKAEIAAYCGAKDPYAPLTDIEGLRQELEAAGAHHQITVFGDAEHGFTDPHADRNGRPGISYNALADKVSWAGTLALLEAKLRT
jgi:dienelactone hydrolase